MNTAKFLGLENKSNSQPLLQLMVQFLANRERLSDKAAEIEDP